MNKLQRLHLALGRLKMYYYNHGSDELGHLGKGSFIDKPADLKNPHNIYIYDHCAIRCRATINSVGDSKFIMKSHSGSAEGLTVITSNHHYPKGSFHGGNENLQYRDIIVEEDVWIGMNVTLLAGTHIGRGAIIGAGSVVRSPVPPYAIVIGNPARILDFRFTIDDILEHEKALYPEEQRFTREQLEKHRKKRMPI